MKKISILWIISGIISTTSCAQANTSHPGKRPYISISAGVAVPILCYASRDPANPDAGFAKTGFLFDFTYAHPLTESIGLGGTFYYAWNRAGNSRVKSVSEPRSYRMFGFMAGPWIKPQFTGRLEGDIRLQAGVSRFFTPALEKGDALWLEAQQSTAFTWGGAMSMRYRFAPDAFLLLKAGHLNAKPKFEKPPTPSGKTEQHIVLMTVDAGIGLKF
ncbi:MAG: hypothetical protein ACO25B_00735 [Chitinophagaceae bacterium]